MITKYIITYILIKRDITKKDYSICIVPSVRRYLYFLLRVLEYFVLEISYVFNDFSFVKRSDKRFRMREAHVIVSMQTI